MIDQHLEWPTLFVVFAVGQTVAAVNIFELVNQSLGAIVAIMTIAWLITQIWSKIKLTNKELEEDE